jgi:N-acetyl-anhydromuramyl-L-alanine amidase AmpD
VGLIFCGGRPIPCDAEVRTWRTQLKLTFPRLRMRTETRMVVAHHTGGEGDAAQVHRTLVERGLSVHFVVDAVGLVTQFVDAEVRAAHAKTANGFSIGIEVINGATDKPGPRNRTLVRENVHGVDATRATFLPAQVTSTLALIEALCGAYELPMAVPMHGTDVLSTVMPAAQLASFRGVVGHLQIDAQKVDPGLALLRAVAAHPLRGRDGAAQ